MKWVLFYLALGFFVGIAVCLKAATDNDPKKPQGTVVGYLFLLGFITTCWPGIVIFWLID